MGSLNSLALGFPHPALFGCWQFCSELLEPRWGVVLAPCCWSPHARGIFASCSTAAEVRAGGASRAASPRRVPLPSLNVTLGACQREKRFASDKRSGCQLRSAARL